MQISLHFLKVRNLESIIDRDPIIVDGEILIGDAIALMAKSGKGVLVTSNNQLLGCLTEKDIVKIVASGCDLTQTKVSQVSDNLLEIIPEKEFTLNSLLCIIQENSLNLIPVVNEDHQIIGTIYPSSILQSLQVEEINLESYSSNSEVIINSDEDQTECEQLENYLLKTEQRFCFLAEFIMEQIWIAKPDGSLEYCNQKVLEYFNCSAEDILGWKWQEYLHPDDVEKTLQIWHYALGNRRKYEVEFRLYHYDSNTYRWHLGRAVPWTDGQGNIISWFGTNTDIHDRVLMENSLKESQRRYETITAISPVGIFHTDIAGNCVYVNHKWSEITGFSLSQALGNGWINALHPDDKQRLIHEWYHSTIQNLPFRSEYRFLCANGRINWVVGQAVSEKNDHGEIVGYIGTITDITELKKVAENLSERLKIADFQANIYSILTQEKTLEKIMSDVTQAIIKHLHAALARIWILNTEDNVLELQVSTGIYQDVNDFNYHRIPVGNLKVGLIAQTGKPYLTNSIENDLSITNKAWAKKQGIIAFAGYPLMVEGEVIGVIAIFSRQVLTESIFVTLGIVADEVAIGIKRRKTEIALQESEERFRNLVEATNDLIWEVDAAGFFTYISPQVKDILGYVPDDILGKHPLELMPKNQVEKFGEIFAMIFAQHQSFKCVENINVHQQGNLVILETNAVPIFDVDGVFKGYRGINRDITIRQQEAAKLQEIQQLIQAILDNSPAVIYVLDTENRYLLVNQQFARLINISKEEVVGKNIYDIWPGDLAELFAKNNLAVIREGIFVEQEECASLTDGLHTYLSMKFPLINTEGNIYAICGISTDITQRKKAEIELVVSQERLQYLLSSSPAVIYSGLIENHGYGNSYITTFMSENVQDMLGYEASEYLASSTFWINHIHPDDLDFVLSSISQLLGERGEYILEYRFLHQDGNYRWVYDQGKIIPHLDMNDQSLQIVGYWADVTNRKKLEQDLIIALEKEKELNELKSRFISMTSHEFRTPLSTILSSAELLEHYGHKWSQEKQLTHLHRIQTAVQRMTEMLNDVLTIGKAEVGKLEYNPMRFDLVSYCRHLVEEFQLHRINQINQTTLVFSSAFQTISCCMDKKLLHHILSNLLSNAIKYSPNGSMVKLILTCEAQKAVFEVEDQGIGIPQEDIPRLFDSFHRGSNVGNILGTGLGLAIVKKCVDIHKGEIFVTSQVNIGTRFTVILPLYSLVTNIRG